MGCSADFLGGLHREGGNEGEVVKLENGRVFMDMTKLTQITYGGGVFTVDASRVLEGKISRVLERAKPLQVADKVKRLACSAARHFADGQHIPGEEAEFERYFCMQFHFFLCG